MKQIAVIAGGAFALLALFNVPALAQAAGAQAYTRACGRCHAVAQVLNWMKPYPDAAERTAYLDRKLTRHYAPDLRARTQIIDFLTAEYAKAVK
jgi:mono/diheme cytochrome c family protein